MRIHGDTSVFREFWNCIAHLRPSILDFLVVLRDFGVQAEMALQIASFLLSFLCLHTAVICMSHVSI